MGRIRTAKFHLLLLYTSENTELVSSGIAPPGATDEEKELVNMKKASDLLKPLALIILAESVFLIA